MNNLGKTHKSGGFPLCTRVLLVVLWVGLAAGCATKRPGPEKVSSSSSGASSSFSKLRPYEIDGTWYYPLPSAAGYREKGLASWYGRKFHRRRTANGERFNMYAMTAAHRTLPLGTVVRVTHLKRHRSVIVRINDRGPFIKNRIIDLSYAAAKALGMTHEGVAPVLVEALGSDSDSPETLAAVRKTRSSPAADKTKLAVYSNSTFTIQIGAFKNRDQALQLKKSMIAEYGFVRIQPVEYYGISLYRVQVGHYDNLGQARREMGRLKKQGFPDAFVVALEAEKVD